MFIRSFDAFVHLVTVAVEIYYDVAWSFRSFAYSSATVFLRRLQQIDLYRCVIVDFDASNHSEQWMRSYCGLDSHTFMYIYLKYCKHSVIDSQTKLYQLFHYLKLYPIIRAHETTSITSIRKYIFFLASVVDELQTVWNSRHEMTNRIPHHFQSMLSGSIDTFPVVVSRPLDSTLQSYLYNGKYKKHVYKVYSWTIQLNCMHWCKCTLLILQVQMMCLHSSAPCFLSGPHFGTISDIKLYRMYTPQLAASECILGDKAYCDQNLVNTIITPIKKQKSKRLSDEENEYNKLHGWYRSIIDWAYIWFYETFSNYQ